MTNMMTILPGGDETMEAALVTPFDQVPDLVEDHEALVEHRHLDVTRKDPGEIGAAETAEKLSLEDGSPHIVSALQTGHHGVGVGVLAALITRLEDDVRFEIGESEVDGRGKEEEVHRVRVVALRDQG